MNNQDFAPYDAQITLPDGKKTSYARLLLIDRENLPKEFSSHAAWLGYIGVLTADAEADLEKAKLDLETLHAEKDAEARLDLNQRGKYTEAMVSSWIQLDGEYISASEVRIEALKTYKTLRAIESAMKEKGSMLISLGATMRQELDMTGLNIRLNRD